MSINAVPTAPLELVAAFGARKLTATFSAFVLSDRLTAGFLAREPVPQHGPSQHVLDGLRRRRSDSPVSSFSFRRGFILRCHMFLPEIIQPVYPLCLPFSSTYLLIVEVLAIAFNSLWLLMTLALFCARHPLRCDHPRGSLSRAQVRGRLSPLPRASTTLAVGLVGQNTGPRGPYPAVPATQNGMGTSRWTV